MYIYIKHTVLIIPQPRHNRDGIVITTAGDDLLSGVPDYFGRNKISSGGDLSHYSSASLY